MTELFMLDLFSGLGGASEAMKKRGWKVVRVDIDPKFKPDVVADIKDFHWGTALKTDLLWASPPCVEFSRESMPWKRTGREPDMTLVRATIRIINETQPRWWVIENVRGARKYFKHLLGEPTKIVGSRYLWGVFPIFDCKKEYGKWRLPPSPDRPALRSKIPYPISLNLALAVERIAEAEG